MFWSKVNVPNGERIILSRKPMHKRITILGMKIKLFFLFFVIFAIYFVSSNGKTPYDYFIRLSDSFLHGKYYITENPPWLSELIPAGVNKFYVVYPPMPAIIAIPFVAILGIQFPQQILSSLLGAGIGILTFLISMKIKKDYKIATWATLLVSFGTIIWYMSSNGSVWLYGQITSAFFLMFAIYESLTKKRLAVVGLCIGAIYLSRPHVVLAGIFLLYLIKDKLKKPRDYMSLAIGAGPFFLFGFIYNFIRFGSLFDKAYFLLPKILHEENTPWFKYGVENIVYIPNNLQTIFMAMPKIIKRFPYIEPSWNGLAIWITTPAFIYAFKSKIKENANKFAWASIILICGIIFSHGGNGFAQFGYRFAVDFYPILIYLVIKGVSGSKLKWHHYLLLMISIFVNLWGIILINRGFVGY